MMFARTNGAHVMIATFQVYLLIAVTLHSSISLTAERCHGTRYPNGSVEYWLSPQGKHCSYVWLHNGIVIAHGGDEERDSMEEHVVAHTPDFLILKSLLENISYKEDCLDSQLGVHPIPCICSCSIPESVVLHPDDDGRHHNVVLVPVLVLALLLILIVSGAVLCKNNPNLCCPTKRLPAREQRVV